MIKRFQLEQKQTNLRTELVAGLTTFLSMVYIIFVNPEILSAAGMEPKAVFVATILSTAFATLLMGLWANYPVALAPGMGINAFFAFTVVATMGYSWQSGLAAILVSGLIFLIICATGLRRLVIEAIPPSLKHAVAAGIGFFIAFIGLKNGGLIVADAATFVALGDLSDKAVLLSLLGFLLTAVFFVMRLPAAIFLGLVVTAILGLLLGVTSLPDRLLAPVPSLEPIFLGALQGFSAEILLQGEFWSVVFAFFFIDFFDTSGVLIAVGQRIGLIQADGSLRRGRQALLTDAIGTIAGSLLGTSSVTSYIESMTGIAAGGKSGLSVVFTALCFLAMLFFSPLLSAIGPHVTAPALIMVGCLMVDSLGRIVWKDLATTVSAFLTVIFMLLSFSIAEGIAVGFAVYPIMMLASRRGREVHPVMYGLMALFVLRFALMAR